MKRTVSLIVVSTCTLAMFAVLARAMPIRTSSAPAIGTVEVWLTTGDGTHKLQRQPDVSFGPSKTNSLQIQVDDGIAYQQMDGFGAALTDSSAWLIISPTLNTSQRDTLMRDLFSSTVGIGISYVRLPMGASDFVMTRTITATQIITHYTYADTPDPSLASFTITHDLTEVIPVLRQAKNINPRLKVMASPWSAPAWMKTEGSLYGGSLQQTHYLTYANYFAKFIQSYSAEGISIDAIAVQNEPHHTSNDYPTMWMGAEQQAEFVRSYLGPTLRDSGFTATQILIWDHNWDEPSYPISVLNTPGVITQVVGSAWHCYAHTPDAQTTVHNFYPDKGIYFTECTGRGDGNFAGDLVWGFQNVAIGATRNWAKTILYWNLVLDNEHGPHIGGCTNCRGLVTIGPNGLITHTAEYYIVGHLSKFVQPGAYRIESGHIPELLESVAFQNPDGSIVLVVLNPENTSKSFDVQWRGQYLPYNLPPQSVATFKWKVHRVYLPVVLQAYHAPVSFQNFELNNGTSGAYFRDAWFAECVFDSTVIHEGAQSIRCHMQAGASGSGNGGTVGIYPSSGSVDLSSATTLSIWAYDPQGNDTIELKLCDDSCCSNGVWSVKSACRNEWAEITWPLSDLACVDKRNIKRIELYEWNDGIYYFDNITWQ